MVAGKGETHRERSLKKVECDHCGCLVSKQYLPKHKMTPKCRKSKPIAHPAGRATEVEEALPLQEPAREYRVSISGSGPKGTQCPVENCGCRPTTNNSMRTHFRNKHLQHIIIIEEEGSRPLPRCPLCGIHGNSVGEKHQASQSCRNAVAQQAKVTAVEIQQKAKDVVFNIDGQVMETVSEFKYLGRILEEGDSDVPTVNRNIKRARGTWGMIGRVLSSEGASPRAMGSFYKVVVQSVLLYGSESWVLSKAMMKKLKSFHNRIARFLTGRHIRQNGDGVWVYPSTKETLEEAGLWTIEEYIRRRKETVSDFAKGRAIYRRCMESTSLSSSPNQLVWWEQ
jgi:hypothetical protein